ncbi:MAG: acetylglutamate kinase [Bacteroidota bacterium]
MSKTTLSIVKTGGKILENPDLLQDLLQGFSQIEGKKILVHGGGKTATQVAEKLGVKTEMINGRRITSTEMLEVAVMVYGGLMNKSLVAKLQSVGMNALGLTGADLNVIQAHKRPVKEIDYGWAGDVDGIDADMLTTLLDQEIVPVMAPLTHDQQGNLLNTNADTIASTVAQGLASQFAVSLIFCFEKAGVLRDAADDDSVIRQINQHDFAAYSEDGTISDGMLPKLHNAFTALEAGVEQVCICHPSGLSTLQSDAFPGTRISLQTSNA